MGTVFMPVASAQLNPYANMYFQNQYLGNPAFAGKDQGLNAGLIYRKQFSQVPGAPVSQALTADYGFNNRAALGLNLNFAKSGLINNSRVMLSYAYHLPLSEKQDLHFGVSVGVSAEGLNHSSIVGADSYDPAINRFNDRKNQLDGDFGMAYTDKNLTLQASAINLGKYLQTDPNFKAGLNYATFLTAVAYKITFNNEFYAEPKVAYRGVKGFDNILDAAVNLSYQNRFNLFGLYHSTQSATFGFGLSYQTLTFTGMYTTNTSAMKGYTNGDFEVGLNYRLNTKNK